MTTNNGGQLPQNSNSNLEEMRVISSNKETSLEDGRISTGRTSDMLDEPGDRNSSNGRARVNKKPRSLTFSLTSPIVIGVTMGILLLLLFLLALSIYFSQQRSCNCSSELSLKEQWKQCMNLSQLRRECGESFVCKNENDIEKYPPKVKDVRLPTDIMPEFYTLNLQVYLHDRTPENFTFNGTVEIKVQCRNTTRDIFVHAFRLMVHKANISVHHQDSKSTYLEIDSMDYDLQRQWFRIKMKNDLKQGQRYLIVINQFEGILGGDLKGWYYSSYEQDGKKKYLATSQLQPTDARKVFPCFDEPAFKSKFQVNLIRRKEFHSLANMPLDKTVAMGNEWYKDVFQPSLTMSTYLLAFVVSEFDSITGTDSKGRNFTVWSRPDVIHTAEYSLKIGIKILEFFESYFRVPYPLNKTDMIAVPNFAAGAMENWGLMIYRELTMLWDPKVGSASSKQKVATVVSHEIAHQWFGNLVTLKWWDDLWLNEGFASFIEYVGVAHVHPNWLMDEQFALNDLQRVLETDSLVNSHPVLMPVYNPDEINDMFDTISYNKGASVLRMMESFLGRGTFQEGLRSYLSQHQYGNTIHDDLWNSLTKQVRKSGRNINVKKVMDTWIKQMGYPLLTVVKMSSNQVRLSQEHFLLNSTEFKIEHDSPYDFIWQIPTTYACQSDPKWDATDDVFWLTNKSSVLNLNKCQPNDWYVFNLEQAGFYRVHYDDGNWEKIRQQLSSDYTKIPFKHRAQLIDDLFNLGKAGFINYTLFLDVTLYLKDETNYFPWEAAVRIFDYMDSILAQDAFYGLFKKYLRHLAGNFYKAVNWEESSNDSHIVNLQRPMVISMACKAGIPECIQKATSLFKAWLKNPNDTSIIPTSLRNTVYCIGVKHGSYEDWYKLYDLRMKSKHEDEIQRMIRALSCTREVWLLKVYLSAMSPYNSQDTLSAISRNPAGKLLAWEYLRDNWKTTLYELGMILQNIPQTTDHLVYSEHHIEQLQMFGRFSESHPNSYCKKCFSQAIDRARTNMAWLHSYRKTIGEWLANKFGNWAIAEE